MNMRATLSAAIRLLALSVSASALAQESELSLQISGLKPNQGQVMVRLFDEAHKDQYPTKRDAALQSKIMPVQDGRARIVFDAPLAPGKYAISVVHDVNGNGKLDTNFIGIPNEPVAASNNAKGTFGPPSFEDAAFTFLGKPLELTIKFK